MYPKKIKKKINYTLSVPRQWVCSVIRL